MPKEQNRKRSLTRPVWISLLCTVLLLAVGVGSVFAYVIIDGRKPNGPQIVETFVPGKVDFEVICTEGTYKDKEGEEKKQYVFTIQNVGEVSAYVRAAYFIEWRSDDGTVYCQNPSMMFEYATNGEGDPNTPDDDWIYELDYHEYFYYPVPVDPGEYATEIIVKDPVDAGVDVAPEGYHFSVTVIAEGIQAVGTNGETPAIQDAWNVDSSQIEIVIGDKGRLSLQPKSNS